VQYYYIVYFYLLCGRMERWKQSGLAIGGREKGREGERRREGDSYI
jgi:hypothetical protein